MLYQGDDLIDVITVSILPKEGEELPEIEAVDLNIGCLKKHFDHPDNPFTVSIMRDESIKLSTKNNCYACIWYYREIDGKRVLLKKTCEGTLVLETKPEIVSGKCKC